MECRRVEEQIYAERDGALDPIQRAELDVHVAQCGACRSLRENLATAMTEWRESTAKVKAPDARLEWQKLHRQIRGGVQPAARRSAMVRWAWPAMAAAALAVAFFITSPFSTNPPASPLADAPRANSSPAGASESTVVFVDDKSGWVFVWTGDGANHI